MATPLRRTLSHWVGWLADRPVPRFLRAPIYRTYARLTGADLAEARGPLEIYPSLSAFFVRRLVEGARPFPTDPMELPSPADGRIQAIDLVENQSLLQAKGMAYSAEELLGEAAEGVDLCEAQAITIYLSPRDYHRVHCPVAARLERVAWLGAARYSVAPGVLARTPRVFVENERVALRLLSDQGPYFLVLVGALNVGRLRVVGVPNGRAKPERLDPHFRAGEELGRFEMGSTAILVWPRQSGRIQLAKHLAPGQPVRLGESLGRRIPRD